AWGRGLSCILGRIASDLLRGDGRMDFEVDVTNWWASFDEEPDKYRNHPAYDGRQLVLHGNASLNRDIYWEDVAEQLDGAECRIYLRPTNPGEKKPEQKATWSQTNSKWWVFLDLNLERSLWEDLWHRTYHPRPKITVCAGIGMKDEAAADSLEVTAWLSSISISS